MKTQRESKTKGENSLNRELEEPLGSFDSPTNILELDSSTEKATSMRRSQRQIIRLMLENAKDGMKPTNLMFASYISWKQLQSYLSLLIDRGAPPQRGPRYHTTMKGLRWLEAYEDLRQLEEPRRT